MALVGSATAAPIAITLDGPQTVGQLTLTATSATSGYTLAAGNGGSLTMNNAASARRRSWSPAVPIALPLR